MWTPDIVGADGELVEAGSKWPKVYVGALSFENGVSGFAWGVGLAAGIGRARMFTSCEKGGEVRGSEADNALGGVMLWDGEFFLLFSFLLLCLSYGLCPLFLCGRGCEWRVCVYSMLTLNGCRNVWTALEQL